ncbi:hypothetical protein, partial [Xanthomonas arboricola]
MAQIDLAIDAIPASRSLAISDMARSGLGLYDSRNRAGIRGLDGFERQQVLYGLEYRLVVIQTALVASSHHDVVSALSINVLKADTCGVVIATDDREHAANIARLGILEDRGAYLVEVVPFQ